MQELKEFINDYDMSNISDSKPFDDIMNMMPDLLEKEKQQRKYDVDAGMSFERNTWKYSIERNDEIRENYFKQ